MPAFRPNPAVAGLQAPPIPAAQAWARAYDGAFGPLVDVSQAAPGGAPPPELLARLGEAAGGTEAARYGPILGDEALREALAADIRASYGTARVSAANVAITAGCNAAFVAASLLAAAPGEAALAPTPWYFNHEMTLSMLGVEARPLPCDPAAGFVPDAAAAEAALDARVRAILLVTPNNPTGATYPPETIAAFADLCRRRGLLLVLDETYRDFRPVGAGAPHGLLAQEGWGENVVHLYSFSKAYAVPGWRLGALVAGEALVAEAAKILDNLQICPTRAGQGALAWGVGALGAWREAARDRLAERAGAFRAALAAHPGWRLDSIGPYFAYVRHPFPGVPAAAVARKLAQERGVLALPGSFFGPGQENHLRVAFANVDAAALAGLERRLADFSSP